LDYFSPGNVEVKGEDVILPEYREVIQRMISGLPVPDPVFEDATVDRPGERESVEKTVVFEAKESAIPHHGIPPYFTRNEVSNIVHSIYSNLTIPDGLDNF